jgi:anti-sigma factor RsiW
MNCKDIQELKHAHADQELDVVSNLEIEKHLGQCDACSRSFQTLGDLHSLTSSDDLYFKSPANLKRRIRSAIRNEVKSANPSAPLFSWLWLRWGFSFAGVALLASVLTFALGNYSANDLLVQEVASSHVRSLMPGHLTDVLSSDQHTVKPWFDGKVDFAPPVIDLADHGFPLVGGRLDYLEDRPVAALVYQRQKHLINLFIWPSTHSLTGTEKAFTQHGYNLVQWNAAGMTYWAVSNLNRNELRDFAQLIQGQVTPPTHP